MPVFRSVSVNAGHSLLQKNKMPQMTYVKVYIHDNLQRQKKSARQIAQRVR